MGKANGRTGRMGGKKSKSLTSTKKKPTSNLSMKRREKEKQRSHELKIKRREAAGKSTPARERREVAGPKASRETMQWGMDGLDEKGEASYIGLDATKVATELQGLNEHFKFTLTHYQNTSYQMLRTGAHDLVRIMHDDDDKVKCFKYK